MKIIKMYSCRSLTLQTPFMQPSSRAFLSACDSAASSSGWCRVGERLVNEAKLKQHCTLRWYQPSENLFCMQDSNAEIYGEP